jgi:hypothetical protein
MWDLGNHAIQDQLWTQQIVENIHNTTSMKCPHVLASLSSDKLQDKNQEEMEAIGPDDLLGNPIFLHALLMKYGTVMSKLKKLQQLEESNAKLTNDIFLLVKDKVDFPLQSRFFANILDGVELVQPISIAEQKQGVRKQSTSRLQHKKSLLKYNNAAEVFQEELKHLSSNTSSIELFKQNEEQFWKWIGTCKISQELQDHTIMRIGENQPALSAFELQLRQAFIPLITRLNGYLSDLENAVTVVVFNNKKVSPQQLASILSYHNANLAEKFNEFLAIVPTLSTPIFGSSSILLAQLLQLPPKSVEVTFANELQELREKHRVLMKKLIEDFSPHSPFRPIIK